MFVFSYIYIFIKLYIYLANLAARDKGGQKFKKKSEISTKLEKNRKYGKPAFAT
jgi:hypothetical protein